MPAECHFYLVFGYLVLICMSCQEMLCVCCVSRFCTSIHILLSFMVHLRDSCQRDSCQRRVSLSVRSMSMSQSLRNEGLY
ncbi:hypothetical protein KP509_05G081400 [Ceratopteris richardii]|uniref:Secreted protein n=1 Tax=Ceratopteris richardii TaxID=49495 RepID=A0A8T2USN1_CERRI|nr:hypothetical protein KP509_05G081400 [Ceratopteris richardii]